MAYSTGARLKSSAVELYRGLESSLQNREQFELALAKVFGSCTGDFQDLQGIPQGHSSLSLEEDSPRNTLGAAPLRRENSNTSSRRNKSGSKASSGKQRKRQGCEGSGSQSSTTPGRPEARERRQSRADYGEHIYAQLFMDDQKRAAQAVSSLRETAVARSPPAGTSSPSPRAVFPVSSPPRNKSKITPLASDDIHIPQTLTFDDAISAISQHTLEAMEDRMKRTRSTDSSLWSSLKESKTPPLAPQRAVSPAMPRVRSTQSKGSRLSRTSHTTSTSDSSSFQKVWQKEEQKFWSTQVEQDSRRSRKSRAGSVRLLVQCWPSVVTVSSLCDWFTCPMDSHNIILLLLATDPQQDCRSYASHHGIFL